MLRRTLLWSCLSGLVHLMAYVCQQIYVSPDTDLKAVILSNLYNTNRVVRGMIYKFDDIELYNEFYSAGEHLGIQYDLVVDKLAYPVAKDLRRWGNVTLFDDPNYEKLHAKGLLFDDARLLMGSFNLDHTTFNKNYEIMVALKGEPYVSQFQAGMQTAKDVARPMSPPPSHAESQNAHPAS